MTPSQACVALIKRYEQCRLTAYLPTPQDVPTIGWGSTGRDVRLGLTWTQDQADERFGRDLSRFGASVSTLLSGVETRQNEFDALVSLAYNIGVSAFAGSTVRRRHIAGDQEGAAKAFAMWNKQKGRVLNGLTRRRAVEARLYREASIEV